MFQVLGPMYSERWFDLKGRTTATMIIAVGMPQTQPAVLPYLIDPIDYLFWLILYSKSSGRGDRPALIASAREY